MEFGDDCSFSARLNRTTYKRLDREMYSLSDCLTQNLKFLSDWCRNIPLFKNFILKYCFNCKLVLNLKLKISFSRNAIYSKTPSRLKNELGKYSANNFTLEKEDNTLDSGKTQMSTYMCMYIHTCILLLVYHGMKNAPYK